MVSEDESITIEIKRVLLEAPGGRLRMNKIKINLRYFNVGFFFFNRFIPLKILLNQVKKGDE